MKSMFNGTIVMEVKQGCGLHDLPHLRSEGEHLCPVQSEGGPEELCHHFL